MRDGRAVRGHRRAGVEPKPAEPEHERPYRRRRHVVAWNYIRFSAGPVLPEPRSEEQDAYQRRPTADGMHDRGAREVEEALGREPATAPDEVAAEGIDDAHHEQREDDEGLELDSLRHRARDDRRGGAGEHELEEELGPERHPRPLPP